MPESFRPPLKADDEKERTYTQTQDTTLAKDGKASRISDILDEKGGVVVSVDVADTLQDAVGRLKENKIGAIVVTKSGEMSGILSERDVVRELGEDGPSALGKAVGDVMTPDPKTASPSDPLLTVAQRMMDGGFRHMPVVDINSKLMGMVSIRDVVAFRLREIEYEALKMKQMIIG